MPRLFAAILLPELIRSQLSLVSAPLTGARWMEPEDYHLTLRFFGDIDNPTADELVGFLSRIAFSPFEIEIDGLGAFGGREPRAIFAAIRPCPGLDQLQRAVERAARSAGLGPETRTFKPHVTLARLRGTRPEAVARMLGHSGAMRCWPFKVEAFDLLSSRPGSGGPPYAHEMAFPARPDW